MKNEIKTTTWELLELLFNLDNQHMSVAQLRKKLFEQDTEIPAGEAIKNINLRG